MAQHSGVFCLLSLSITLLLVENAFASPLMSVHGDAAGRRHRMSTSWWRHLEMTISNTVKLGYNELYVTVSICSLFITVKVYVVK